MAAATPARIILIRHAEKPGETKTQAVSDDAVADTGLAPRGAYRAGAYAAYFDPKRSGGLYPAIEHIFATKATAHSNRPVLTVTPLAAALGKKIHDQFDDKPAGISGLAAELLGGNYAGEVILVCWHHGTLPDVVKALGYPNPPKIAETAIDLVWTLAYEGGAPSPSFTQVQQNLMYGD